jgi:glutamate-1-semialdehyde 2,1-aminomutase
MALFDPARPGALPHAGTFNNNVASMAAGHAGLTRVYPAEVAERHAASGDALRARLAALFQASGAPFQATGVGSLLAMHATAAPLRSPRDLSQSDARLLELLFLDLLESGYYIAPRGYMALSLALGEDDLSGFLAVVQEFLGARSGLWS